MLATFVSALVTCAMKVPARWTGAPSGGVRRSPMLVGTTRAYLQFCFSSIFMFGGLEDRVERGTFRDAQTVFWHLGHGFEGAASFAKAPSLSPKKARAGRR